MTMSKLETASETDLKNYFHAAEGLIMRGVIVVDQYQREAYRLWLEARKKLGVKLVHRRILLEGKYENRCGGNQDEPCTSFDDMVTCPECKGPLQGDQWRKFMSDMQAAEKHAKIADWKERKGM